jgi:hypothetical protein
MGCPSMLKDALGFAKWVEHAIRIRDTRRCQSQYRTQRGIHTRWASYE